MKRLVYSPSINVYIKTDHGVVDLSDYVTDCSVNRLVNQVSTATVTFRNPKVITASGKNRFMFTEHEDANGRVGPVFHPMDPIIITMTRLRGKPIQVFTGYCDTTPYVQLFPGVAQIKASCTLKRLLHTYWDPGLSFVTKFMSNYGWGYDAATGTSIRQNSKDQKTNQLNDTGIGNLLMAVLNEVGGWEKEDILLQPLPSKAIQNSVSKIFDDLVKSGKENTKEYVDYISEYINASGNVNGGSGGSTSSGAGGPGSGAPGNWPTFPPGTGRVVAASEFTPYRGDSGGAFGGAGTRTPDGVIPGGNPPPRGGVNDGYWFGETSTNWQSPVPDSALDFSALGNLPYGTPVQVTHEGKSIIARKADSGRGGEDYQGHKRCIDLWIDAAQALGVDGMGLVKVKVLTEDMVKQIRGTN